MQVHVLRDYQITTDGTCVAQVTQILNEGRVEDLHVNKCKY